MNRTKPSAYRSFRALATDGDNYSDQVPVLQRPGIPHAGFSRPLEVYQRCHCGRCRECLDNARWDRIFARFESTEREERGMFQCALNDL